MAEHKSNTKNTATMTLRLQPSLLAIYDQMSAETGFSKNFLIKHAMNYYINKSPLSLVEKVPSGSTVTTTIRISRYLLQNYDELARHTHISRNGLINMAMMCAAKEKDFLDYLNEQEIPERYIIPERKRSSQK